MRNIVLAILGLVVLSAPVQAQEADDQALTSGTASSGASGAGMNGLLAKGYEIKAAVPNGTRYIVFLQKDKSAYACEFVTLTKSRCGSIN